MTAGALVAPPTVGAAPQVPPAASGPRPPAPAWCDEPMRWAQLVLVENDPGPRRSRVLARLLPPRPRRRGLPQRRRHRRLLPHRRPLPSPQRLARHQRSVRRAGPRLPRHADEGDRPHRPARDPRRHRARPSRLDRGRRRRTAAPPLGQPGAVGHLRARALQLRVHDRRPPRDRLALRHRRHLHQPLGQPDRLLLRPLPAELPRRQRSRICPARPTPPIPSAAPSSPGARPASPSCGRCGTPTSAARGRAPASCPTVHPTCAPPG